MAPENQFTLLTDLYELTMAAAYYEHGMFAPATFSLFIREYPKNRGYFLSAGLEQVNISPVVDLTNLRSPIF